ncbi:hypothetical protein [Nonomuraea rubra]
MRVRLPGVLAGLTLLLGGLVAPADATPTAAAAVVGVELEIRKVG